MSAKAKLSPCTVCGGMGGWYNSMPIKEDNYTDCLYCSGKGFCESSITEEAKDLAFLLVYNAYRKLITEQIEKHGKIIRYLTEDGGKTISIEVVPYDRADWHNISKSLLKFGHFNSALDIKCSQNFYYQPKDDRFYYYWTLTVHIEELKNLDGFVEILQGWNEQNRKGYVNNEHGEL